MQLCKFSGVFWYRRRQWPRFLIWSSWLLLFLKRIKTYFCEVSQTCLQHQYIHRSLRRFFISTSNFVSFLIQMKTATVILKFEAFAVLEKNQSFLLGRQTFVYNMYYKYKQWVTHIKCYTFSLSLSEISFRCLSTFTFFQLYGCVTHDIPWNMPPTDISVLKTFTL